MRVNSAAAKRMLAPYKDPALTLRAQRATMAGAEVLRRPLQREGGKVSKRMSKAVSIRASTRYRPGAFIEFKPEVAPFRHWVIGGTRAHGARGFRRAVRFRGRFGWVTVRRVRGVRRNPIIVRTVGAYRTRVNAAMIRYLTRTAP